MFFFIAYKLLADSAEGLGSISFSNLTPMT